MRGKTILDLGPHAQPTNMRASSDAAERDLVELVAPSHAAERRRELRMKLRVRTTRAGIATVAIDDPAVRCVQMPPPSLAVHPIRRRPRLRMAKIDAQRRKRHGPPPSRAATA